MRSTIALACVLALTACQGGGNTYTTAPPERTITVTGTARVEVVPDEACIELTLAARDPSMPAAHAQLRAGMDALIAELRQNHALTVETGAIAYSPDYDTDSGRSRLIGHIASAQINVRTGEFAQIPDVVGRAAARGLDRVQVVYYSTEIVSRRAEVRTHALEAARDKARTMAETLGTSVDEVITITEGDATTNPNVNVGNYFQRASADSAPDLPAPPGAIPLTVSVSVVYRLG